MWVLYINFSLHALNLIIYCWRFSQLSKALRLIGPLIGVTSLVEAIAAYHMLTSQANNLYLFHLLTPFQYTLFSLMIYQATEQTLLKKSIGWSIPAFIIISLSVSLLVQKMDSYNSISLSLQNVLLTIWSVLFIHELVTRRKVFRIEAEPMLYISVGLIVYSCGKFMVEGLMNYFIKKDINIAKDLYTITELLSFLLYVVVAFSLLCQYLFPAQLSRYQDE